METKTTIYKQWLYKSCDADQLHYVQKQQLAVPTAQLLIDASPHIVSYVISCFDTFVCLIEQGERHR